MNVHVYVCMCHNFAINLYLNIFGQQRLTSQVRYINFSVFLHQCINQAKLIKNSKCGAVTRISSVILIFAKMQKNIKCLFYYRQLIKNINPVFSYFFSIIFRMFFSFYVFYYFIKSIKYCKRL